MALTNHISDDVSQLRHEVFDLKAALRSRPLIARALGLLQGRYDLTDDTAFTLMRDSAQRHNLKLSTLASSLLAAKPPAGRDWFPGRIRRLTPKMSYLPERQTNRTAVLTAFLDTVLGTMDADAGDLQLVDQLTGALQLEQHRGLSVEFIDFFATVTDGETSCGTALRRRSRVIVTDVAKDPIFAGTASGEMVLDAGVHSVQSTPLVLPDGRCVAMVSTHYARKGRGPTGTEGARLDKLALETALWLDWHQRTVVLDALERVHQEALRLR
ncbi:GAF and ANTAR domain-containing protein [Kibdelosporangium aridum]|uniref:GAF and ANTAR domain-containing protein n=1 Tax=Kibdelosporangium aridum TaxID=2030 RepID=UPI0035F08FC3